VSHAYHDAVSLELARRAADRLDEHPERIALARDNLRRWMERNASAAGLVRCYQEWLAILDRPVDEIQAILLAETDEGQRLRQSSPFAGVVPFREVWAIKREIRERMTSEQAGRDESAA